MNGVQEREALEDLLRHVQSVIRRAHENMLVNADATGYGTYSTDLGNSIIGLAWAANTLRAALTTPAPAGAAGERWLPFWELYEVPRLSGGVLSIGHDIDPDRPMDALSTTVIRHEFRGRVREVEVAHGENPYERLRVAEWRERNIPADDLLEALKLPFQPERTPAERFQRLREVSGDVWDGVNPLEDRQERVTVPLDLEEDMRRALEEIARQTGRSVSDVIREGLGLFPLPERTP